ncbi:hypothetical protein SHKM778_66040 [Streptomyces sp. KM77-8]|uniref:Uncharacterized protein n=1 Tax=Streptomyces haneummycinicus TaxID=3074435 RepID=A0AAT9HSA3_9ACTN
MPGSVESTYAFAVLIRERQELSDWSTQVVMTSANPASLPPTLIETSPVAVESGPSCPERTSPVRAPEQAVKSKDEGECAAAQRYGCALVLRLQSPLLER